MGFGFLIGDCQTGGQQSPQSGAATHRERFHSGIEIFHEALAATVTGVCGAQSWTCRSPRQDDITEEQLAVRGAAVPFGRMAEAAEMVPTVVFLCSAGAAYITGQTLHVNGGSWMA